MERGHEMGRDRQILTETYTEVCTDTHRRKGNGQTKNMRQAKDSCQNRAPQLVKNGNDLPLVRW